MSRLQHLQNTAVKPVQYVEVIATAEAEIKKKKKAQELDKGV